MARARAKRTINRRPIIVGVLEKGFVKGLCFACVVQVFLNAAWSDFEYPCCLESEKWKNEIPFSKEKSGFPLFQFSCLDVSSIFFLILLPILRNFVLKRASGEKK